MFRLGKSDLNANFKDRKGSTDIDTLDGIEHTEKLYLPSGSRTKRISGWGTGEPKELSPKTSSVQQPSRKSSLADTTLLLSDDDKDDFDDYVADISDAVSSVNHPGSALHEIDSRVNLSSLSLADDIDLSLLTKHLHSLEDVMEEADEVWTWDGLFTKVVSELRAEGKYK